jgi:hypothetical protein
VLTSRVSTVRAATTRHRREGSRPLGEDENQDDDQAGPGEPSHVCEGEGDLESWKRAPSRHQRIANIGIQDGDRSPRQSDETAPD